MGNPNRNLNRTQEKPTVSPETIPQFFKERNNWVGWRFKEVDGKQKKQPVDKAGYLISITDPRNFLTYRQVVDFYQQTSRWSGIGFALTPRDGLCCIDIDNAFTEGGALKTQAWLALKTIGATYVERSPSGNGLHIWARATIDSGRKFTNLPEGVEVEVYGRDRYMTMTGDSYQCAGHDHCPQVEPRQAEIEALVAELEQRGRLGGSDKQTEQGQASDRKKTTATGGQEQTGATGGKSGDWRSVELDLNPMTDEDAELVGRICKGKQREKFIKLWERGDESDYLNEEGKPNHSAADQALMNIFPWYTTDTKQICRIFISSKLAGREKTQTRNDYIQRTIKSALDFVAKRKAEADFAGYQSDYRHQPGGEQAEGGPYLNDTARKAWEEQQRRQEQARQEKAQREQREREHYHGKEGETLDDFLAQTTAEQYDDFERDTLELSEREEILTGLSPLDKALGGGLAGKQLYIIAAVPGLGKTSLVAQFADTMMEQGHDTIFFSIEVTKRQLMAKSISRRMREIANGNQDLVLSAGQINKGKFLKWASADLLAVYKRAIRECKEASRNGGHVWIVRGEGRPTSADDMRAYLERYKRHFPDKTPIVFLDYFQLMRKQNPQASDKQNADDNIWALKDIADKFNLPVIAISALNRNGYQNPDDLASLKESGLIEYTADALLILKYVNKRGHNCSFKEAQAEVNGEPVVRVGVNIIKSREETKGDIPGGLLFYPKAGIYTANNGQLAEVDKLEELLRGANALKETMEAEEIGIEGIAKNMLIANRKKGKTFYSAVSEAYRGQGKGAPRFNKEEMAAVIEEAIRLGYVVEVTRPSKIKQETSYIILKSVYDAANRTERKQPQGGLFDEDDDD